LLEINTEVNEEEEHINVTADYNSGKNNEKEISSNCIDIFDIDSDDDDDCSVQMELGYRIGLVRDDGSKESLSVVVPSTNTVSTTSSSSSATTPLTINRSIQNFTEPYMNNLENFDDDDVREAINNCGFFATKRKTADNFATIMRVSNNNNNNNFEIGGTIVLIKNLDNKYIKLSNMRQALLTQLMKSCRRIEYDLLGYKSASDSVDVATVEDRRLLRNYKKNAIARPSATVSTTVENATMCNNRTNVIITNISAGIAQPGNNVNINNNRRREVVGVTPMAERLVKIGNLLIKMAKWHLLICIKC